MKVYFKTKNGNIFKLDILPEENKNDVPTKIQYKGGIISTQKSLSKSTELQHGSDTYTQFLLEDWSREIDIELQRENSHTGF